MLLNGLACRNLSVLRFQVLKVRSGGVLAGLSSATRCSSWSMRCNNALTSSDWPPVVSALVNTLASRRAVRNEVWRDMVTMRELCKRRTNMQVIESKYYRDNRMSQLCIVLRNRQRRYSFLRMRVMIPLLGRSLC